MKHFGDDDHPQIEYPCEWEYTVIGLVQAELEAAVATAAAHRSYRVELSKTSKGGKYLSLKAWIEVNTEPERLRVFEALAQSEATRFVI